MTLMKFEFEPEDVSPNASVQISLEPCTEGDSQLTTRFRTVKVSLRHRDSGPSVTFPGWCSIETSDDAPSMYEEYLRLHGSIQCVQPINYIPRWLRCDHHSNKSKRWSGFTKMYIKWVKLQFKRFANCKRFLIDYQNCPRCVCQRWCDISTGRGFIRENARKSIKFKWGKCD